MSEPYIGEIRMFGFEFAPRGWAFCAGQLLSIEQNTALFALLGIIYGGDGRRDFALPDLQGRVAMGMGVGRGLTDRRIGQTGGAEKITQSPPQLASHSHRLAEVSPTSQLKGVSEDGNEPSPRGNYLAGLDGAYRSGSGATVVDMDAGSLSVTVPAGETGDTGGNEPMNNLQPYLVVNYSIAIEGLAPSRS